MGHNAPAVTIIRPVKGLEPHLEDCIKSSFRQDYPIDKLSIRLCVDDRSDPAYPVLSKIVEEFPHFDAKVMVESDSTHEMKGLGPNPKIRNISRSYKEAKSDIVWVVDCNVWIARGVIGRMVDKLMGYSKGGTARPYKFVHQLPLVVDIVDYARPQSLDGQTLLSSASEASPSTDLAQPEDPNTLTQIRYQGGGRLDEMFMASTHAKFYGAINAVGIAPCIVGKSNMFRKSHLDQVTDPAQNPILPQEDHLNRPPGVDYFSHNICEDHSIGDILWRSKIPGHKNHGIVWGDLVVQPMAGMSVRAYIARRVRWLRARKFTVLAATLVEPGVESLLCGLCFSYAITTLPWFDGVLGITQTRAGMFAYWAIFVTAWMLADWAVFCRLHSARSIQIDENTPAFAKGTRGPKRVYTRYFLEWLPAWIGREIMALPIWTWAVLLGGTVNWRGKTFQVHYDTTVHEIEDGMRSSRTSNIGRSRPSSKDRRD